MNCCACVLFHTLDYTWQVKAESMVWTVTMAMSVMKLLPEMNDQSKWIFAVRLQLRRSEITFWLRSKEMNEQTIIKDQLLTPRIFSNKGINLGKTSEFLMFVSDRPIDRSRDVD